MPETEVLRQPETQERPNFTSHEGVQARLLCIGLTTPHALDPDHAIQLNSDQITQAVHNPVWPFKQLEQAANTETNFYWRGFIGDKTSAWKQDFNNNLQKGKNAAFLTKFIGQATMQDPRMIDTIYRRFCFDASGSRISPEVFQRAIIDTFDPVALRQSADEVLWLSQQLYGPKVSGEIMAQLIYGSSELRVTEGKERFTRDLNHDGRINNLGETERDLLRTFSNFALIEQSRPTQPARTQQLPDTTHRNTSTEIPRQTERQTPTQVRQENRNQPVISNQTPQTLQIEQPAQTDTTVPERGNLPPHRHNQNPEQQDNRPNPDTVSQTPEQQQPPQVNQPVLDIEQQRAEAAPFSGSVELPLQGQGATKLIQSIFHTFPAVKSSLCSAIEKQAGLESVYFDPRDLKVVIENGKMKLSGTAKAEKKVALLGVDVPLSFDVQFVNDPSDKSKIKMEAINLTTNGVDGPFGIIPGVNNLARDKVQQGAQQAVDAQIDVVGKIREALAAKPIAQLIHPVFGMQLEGDILRIIGDSSIQKSDLERMVTEVLAKKDLPVALQGLTINSQSGKIAVSGSFVDGTIQQTEVQQAPGLHARLKPETATKVVQYLVGLPAIKNPLLQVLQDKSGLDGVNFDPNQLKIEIDGNKLCVNGVLDARKNMSTQKKVFFGLKPLRLTTAKLAVNFKTFFEEDPPSSGELMLKGVELKAPNGLKNLWAKLPGIKKIAQRKVDEQIQVANTQADSISLNLTEILRTQIDGKSMKGYPTVHVPDLKIHLIQGDNTLLMQSNTAVELSDAEAWFNEFLKNKQFPVEFSGVQLSSDEHALKLSAQGNEKIA
ncbi:hypothetical protein HGA88_06415 [Candidatus Roizmanbacteria bacterium]|nr:hypothetical protein [Candidatus Roizmanbacteria bacterium]